MTKKLRHLLSRFKPVSGRVATIRIKVNNLYVSLICAPIEENVGDTKKMLYERLVKIYDRYPSHTINFVIGDFNAKTGMYSGFKPIIGNFNLHANTSDNEMRLRTSPWQKNMVTSGTRFKHKMKEE